MLFPFVNCWLLVLIAFYATNICMQSAAFHIAPADVTQDIAITIDALRNAAIPTSIGTTLAIGASEAVAGAVGGLASRGTANAIGDRKIDSVATKVSSTSAFFGTRGLLYGGGLLLGLPRPLARGCASLIASIVSEEVKLSGRNNNSSSVAEQLQLPEIAGDVSKWLIYDALTDKFQKDHIKALFFPEDIAVSFLFGGLSAVGGVFIQDNIKMMRDNGKNIEEKKKIFTIPKLLKYAKTAAEGAVLFGCYKIILAIIISTIPEALSAKFVLDQVIETIEQDVISFGDGNRNY